MAMSMMEKTKGSPSVPEIFLTFLRIGVTAFGGPAMVSRIKEAVVDKKGWIDDDTYKHGVALCQTLPGAIAINAAAYAGYRAGGLGGMFACFVGFTFPAFVMLLVLSAFYVKTWTMPVMESLFGGLR